MTSQQSVAERTDPNQEGITLIWFDPSVDSQQDNDAALKRLREVNDYVLCYNELDACRKRIQSIRHDRILLITSDTRAADLLPSIVNLPQIDSVFVFCMNKDECKPLNNEHLKIIGIYDDLDALCPAIEQQVHLVEKQLETFSVFDRLGKSTKDLSKQSAEFLWLQLLKNALNRLPSGQHAKKHILDVCRSYYRGNAKQLKQIEDYEHNYRSDAAIEWYAKKSFVYKLLNRALRNKDINQLHYFRFFIDDLSKSLAREHQKIVQSPEKTISVYRGVRLSSEELNQFKENHGKLLAANGYLLASRHRKKALASATDHSESADRSPVLFEITCHMQHLDDKFIFADIATFTDRPDDREVLFDLGSVFRLDSVQEDESVWVIKMSASSEGQAITRDYLESTRRETEEKTEAIMFGRLMCQMGYYDQARRYFEQLLVRPYNEDVAWIEFNLGHAAHHNGDFARARELYDQAFDRLMYTNPPRTKESAYMLNNIGHVLEMQGKHDESRQFYQRALKVRETHCPVEHPDITISLKSIGNLLYKRQKYDEALNFFQRALNIQEKHYPDNHADLANTLNHISKALLRQGKNSEALKASQRALKIQEERYTPDYPDKVESLNNIGASYEKLKVPRMALVQYKRALPILEKELPVGNPYRVKTETSLQRVSTQK